MAVREAPPTYRELITYDEPRKRWVFDPQWLQWFLRQTAALGAVITDHGGLTGLADDDHPQYRDRAGHTGTQLAATISDFDAQVRTSRLDQMAVPTASVSFNGQQALSFRIENRTSDPGSPATGQIWLRTDL